MLDKDGLKYIELNTLLKISNIVDSGGMANQVIGSEAVAVDGEIETRKKRKLYGGEFVELAEDVLGKEYSFYVDSSSIR